MSPEKQALLDALTAERYGRNEWWTSRQMRPELDDSDVSQARRRRALAEAWGDAKEESA